MTNPVITVVESVKLSNEWSYTVIKTEEHYDEDDNKVDEPYVSYVTKFEASDYSFQIGYQVTGVEIGNACIASWQTGLFHGVKVGETNKIKQILKCFALVGIDRFLK